MSESYTETTTEGYFSRVTGAIKGVVVGGVMFLASFALLFWNEGRTLRQGNVLEEVAEVALTVDPKLNNVSKEGKLVHFTGHAVGEKLADPQFGLSREAIHLERVVEMYQWREDKKTRTHTSSVGGKKTTETTYEYDRAWSDKVIDSDRFHDSDGHENPTAMRVPAERWSAKTVTVGTYTLPPDLAAQIDNYAPVPADEAMLAGLSPELRRDAAASGGRIYIAAPSDFGRRADPARPKVGDVRVSFRVVEPGPVSVIARQTGATVGPYQAKDGSFAALHVGAKDLPSMVAAEKSTNSILGWILRLVGFIVMWIGLAVVFNPFRVLADAVGLVGDIVGMGIAVLSGLVALFLSLTTIAAAWLFYRPVVGVGLLLLAATVIYWLNNKRKARHARRAEILAAQMASPSVVPTSLPPLPPAPASQYVPAVPPPVPGLA